MKRNRKLVAVVLPLGLLGLALALNVQARNVLKSGDRDVTSRAAYGCNSNWSAISSVSDFNNYLLSPINSYNGSSMTGAVDIDTFARSGYAVGVCSGIRDGCASAQLTDGSSSNYYYACIGVANSCNQVTPTDYAATPSQGALHACLAGGGPNCARARAGCTGGDSTVNNFCSTCAQVQYEDATANHCDGSTVMPYVASSFPSAPSGSNCNGTDTSSGKWACNCNGEDSGATRCAPYTRKH